ncbi:hypothetical protein K0M31_000262 [Melipona bicolor]|uniref:Uncharacterized protein n=1 Tax=Melipona bicolor TaxID=60889 RepID=A0AA40KWW0_9HYME|nr:hypothetical protein K0M31_000262 [Melipona bicolor]
MIQDIPKAESSPTKVESQEASQKKSQEAGSKSSSASGKQQEAKDEGKDEEKEREEAATRIQAAFRGHHARKSMKETESSTKQTGTKSNSDPTKEQLQQEFRADDKGECVTCQPSKSFPKGKPLILESPPPFLPISSETSSMFLPDERKNFESVPPFSDLLCSLQRPPVL